LYAKSDIIKDILKDLNEIGKVVLSGQNGKKPPQPYAELNIISEIISNEFDEVRYMDKDDQFIGKYKNNVKLTLSLTHHSKDNLDDEINYLADYFRVGIKKLQSKYGFSVLSEPNIMNRNTILNVEFSNIKGFDVTLFIDYLIEDVTEFIEEVQL